MRRRTLLQTALCGPWLIGAARAAPVERLSIIGSDTLAPLCLAWLARLQADLPRLQVRFQASGSSTAAQALIEGAADFGPMSRRLTREETQAFIERHGHAPRAIVVALDAIAVVVHPDNPLRQLSLHSLDGIYSSTRWCAPAPALRRWGQLGLGGDWRRAEIVSYGRNTTSGTFEQFRQQALCAGDFRPQVQQLLASAAVVRAVSTQRRAIGYSGAGHTDDSVRTLPLMLPDGVAVAPTADAVVSERYPLSRPLLIYTLGGPDEPLRPAAAAFLQLVLSASGQALAPAAGLIPLPLERLAQQRLALGLDGPGI